MDNTEEEVIVDAGEGDEEGVSPIAEASQRLLDSMSDEEKESPYADEPDGEESEEEAEEEEAEGDEEEKPAAQEKEEEEKPAESGKVVSIKLPGQKERGEKVLEIDVPADDQEMVDRVRRLAKDGMRKAEYDTAMQAVREERAELDDIKTHLEHDPNSWILENVPQDKKLDLGRTLLAELWDELQEDIDKFSDETARKEARVTRREQSLEAKDKIESARDKRDYAGNVFAAVHNLIPEGTDDVTARRFIADAERDLMDEMKRTDRRVALDAIKDVLDYRIRMYGFGKKGKTTRSTDGKPRPASDKARDIAERGQDRRKSVAVRRRGVVAAGSPGTGAISSRPPKVSKGATIEEASAELRNRLNKQGGGDSWGQRG